eukprot:497912-Pelagomonas_calceolata.AAC.3
MDCCMVDKERMGYYMVHKTAAALHGMLQSKQNRGLGIDRHEADMCPSRAHHSSNSQNDKPENNILLLQCGALFSPIYVGLDSEVGWNCFLVGCAEGG